MEQHIQNAMNDSIIKQAAPHYGVEFEDIKRLGGFENFIYEYSKNNEDFILRFVHSTHRTFEQVFAELEFIEYLSNNGANVSMMIHTENDELLIKIPTENDEYFTVSAFTKAPGTYVDRSKIDDEFNYQFGQAVGKLHALTKTYNPFHKRYHWHEEDYIEIGKRNLPEDLQYIVDIAYKHQDKLMSYDYDKDSYGLIHTDLHFGNMYYDGEKLTFFDWDDASYKHFISDIAIIIFYQFGISKLTDQEIEEKTIAFLKPFMKGYNEYNQIDKIWFERLNEFLMLRQIILSMVIYASGEQTINSPFGELFLGKYIDRIKNNTPFFDLERVLKAVWNS